MPPLDPISHAVVQQSSSGHHTSAALFSDTVAPRHAQVPSKTRDASAEVRKTLLLAPWPCLDPPFPACAHFESNLNLFLSDRGVTPKCWEVSKTAAQCMQATCYTCNTIFHTDQHLHTPCLTCCIMCVSTCVHQEGPRQQVPEAMVALQQLQKLQQQHSQLQQQQQVLQQLQDCQLHKRAASKGAADAEQAAAQ